MSEYDKERAAYMLKVAARYIEENGDEGQVFYDETWCDGACVAEECREAAEAISGDKA